MKIHLPNFNAFIILDDLDRITGQPVLGLKRLFVFNEDVLLFTLEIDERYYNEMISYDVVSEDLTINTLFNFIKSKFIQFKNSDVRYGNYHKGDGYQGSIPLCAIDFLNYIKTENRDIIISDILKDEHN